MLHDATQVNIYVYCTLLYLFSGRWAHVETTNIICKYPFLMGQMKVVVLLYTNYIYIYNIIYIILYKI